MIGPSSEETIITTAVKGENEKAEEKKILTLEILRIIKDSQQQHGLRHGDFQRYRCYCTRRIRRLRKTLHLTQGDKRHYKRRDVAESHLKDERCLLIPLMLCERVWSYAMQLRQEANTEPRKRFHMIARLQKATGHAKHLHTLCQSDLCDARSKLESQAYLAWIEGSLYFELQQWSKAMDCLNQALVVYSKLSEGVNEDASIVYKQRCDELQPSLRYCSYSMGETKAIQDLHSMRSSLTADPHLLDKLDALMEEAVGRDRKGDIADISWRGWKVIVRGPGVASFVAAENSLSSPDIDTLDRHLIKCKDAIAAVRELIASSSSGGQQDSVDNQSASNDRNGKNVWKTSNHLLLTFLMHIRLSRTIERTQLMIENTISEDKKYKAQDLIRLYEIILQNLAEMQQLPGLERDASYLANVDKDINKNKAYRCYYMSEALKTTKHFKEAHGVLQRGLSYAQQAGSSPEIVDLIKKLDVAEVTALAMSVLQADSSTTSTEKKILHKADLPLIDRLDEYRQVEGLTKNPNFVHFPPDMSPIPYKPLFFDVAVNHVVLPTLDTKPAGSSEPSKQGISGFVKGLWGWGGGSK